MAEARRTVFVSYAHEDRKWVDELRVSLAIWIRDKRVNLWDDSRIQPGDDWHGAIRKALDEATVVVLLVTRHFLASDFIMRHELPLVLERAERKEIRLMWIAVDYSAVAATSLVAYQAVNDPSRPISAIPPAQRSKTLVDIAEAIANAVTIGTFAGSLEIIDETTEPLAAAVERRPEEPRREHRVQAVYEPQKDTISFRGSAMSITVADLSRLPPDDREFIADLEDSLARNYARWKVVRKALGDAGGALDAEIEAQLTRIAKLICKDLNAILDFLRKMHKYELEDHYGRYRYICEQVQAA